MGMVVILIIMEHNIKDTGKTINSMDKVKKHGQMVLIMKDNMMKVKSMEKENQFLQINLILMVNLIIMIYMVMDYIYGLIKESMKDNGREIKCMEMEKQLGQMEDLIMESK